MVHVLFCHQHKRDIGLFLERLLANDVQGSLNGLAPLPLGILKHGRIEPGLFDGPTFQTDTYFGFSGGDVAPFVPGEPIGAVQRSALLPAAGLGLLSAGPRDVADEHRPRHLERAQRDQVRRGDLCVEQREAP